MVMVSPAVASPSAASGAPSASDPRSSKPSKQPAAGESFIRLWPPGSRTRSQVTIRITENLKSLASIYYPQLEPEEASRIAAQLEQAAFEEAELEERESSRVSDAQSNGSSAVRVYARAASKMVLDVLKTGKLPDKGKLHDVQGAGEQKVVDSCVTNNNNVETEDTASTPGILEWFDISNMNREVLELEKCKTVFQALADPGNTFTKVRLSNWGFTKEAAQFAGDLLAKMKDRLVAVDLSDIVAGRTEEEALRVMNIFSSALEGSELRYLNLSNNALGEKGVRAFGALLKSQKKLEELHFENNGISPEAAQAIHEMVSGSSLKVLHFHNNMTGDAGAEWLAKLVSQATGLEDLRISTSRVGLNGALALAEALRGCSGLKKLALTDNMFKDAGEALGGALRNKPLLEELHASDLALEDEGVGAILRALGSSAPGLRVLDLGNNEITAAGAPAVAEYLESIKPGKLRRLSLAENELGDKGVIIVCKALRGSHGELEELDLTLNQLGTDGAVAAAKAVANKVGFKRLILESNHISGKGLAAVEAALEAGVAGKKALVPLDDNDEDFEGDDDEEVEDEEVGDSELELQRRVNALNI